MGFFLLLVQLVLGLLPDDDVPAFAQGAASALQSVFSAGYGLGAWIPWSTAAVCAGAVIASLLIGLAIRVVRIIASFFTLGGGSAA